MERTVRLLLALVTGWASLFAVPSLAKTHHRIPSDYSWGRCLLIVEGKTRISGRCAYRIDKDGSFVIEGPKQVYDGIDYPAAGGSLALMQSTDYWANVFQDEGTWDGYGNEDASGVNGQGPNFGPLRRAGACLLNERVRVCLWKK